VEGSVSEFRHDAPRNSLKPLKNKLLGGQPINLNHCLEWERMYRHTAQRFVGSLPVVPSPDGHQQPSRIHLRVTQSPSSSSRSPSFSSRSPSFSSRSPSFSSRSPSFSSRSPSFSSRPPLPYNYPPVPHRYDTKYRTGLQGTQKVLNSPQVLRRRRRSDVMPTDPGKNGQCLYTHALIKFNLTRRSNT
jgi:hypothetical protein